LRGQTYGHAFPLAGYSKKYPRISVPKVRMDMEAPPNRMVADTSSYVASWPVAGMHGILAIGGAMKFTGGLPKPPNDASA